MLTQGFVLLKEKFQDGMDSRTIMNLANIRSFKSYYVTLYTSQSLFGNVDADAVCHLSLAFT